MYMPSKQFNGIWTEILGIDVNSTCFGVRWSRRQNSREVFDACETKIDRTRNIHLRWMLIIEGIFQASSSSSHGGSTWQVGVFPELCFALNENEEGRWKMNGGKRCNWRSFQSHYKDSPQRSSSTLSLYWWLNGPECFQITSPYPRIANNNKKKEEIGLKISLSFGVFSFPSLHFAILFRLYRFVWIEHQNKRPEGKRREISRSIICVPWNWVPRSLLCNNAAETKANRFCKLETETNFCETVFSRNFFYSQNWPIDKFPVGVDKGRVSKGDMEIIRESKKFSKTSDERFHFFWTFQLSKQATFYRRDVPAPSTCLLQHETFLFPTRENYRQIKNHNR